MKAEHQFSSLGDPKKAATCSKDFFGKRALIRHISRKTKLNSPYLYRRFLYGASKLRGLENCLLFSLTYSQIWLSHLLDDRQSTYLTNFGKKNFVVCSQSGEYRP
jgi:hypothetical protein